MRSKLWSIPLTLSLIAMISCSEGKEQASSPGELAQAVHKALAKEDKDGLQRLLVAEPPLKESLKSMGRIVPQDSSPIRIDSSEKELRLFYRIQGAYYAIQGKPVQEKQKGYRLKAAERLDLTDSCDRYQHQRYTPSDKVSFSDLRVKIMENGKAFRSATLHAKNQLEQDLKDIKVRIKLFKKGKDGNPQMVYRRAVVPNTRFPSGKKTAFELPELKGYAPGGKIDTNKLSFKTDILDAAPKPEYKYCKMVERLNEGGQ